jgi:hypothetical protein
LDTWSLAHQYTRVLAAILWLLGEMVELLGGFLLCWDENPEVVRVDWERSADSDEEIFCSLMARKTKAKVRGIVQLCKLESEQVSGLALR